MSSSSVRTALSRRPAIAATGLAAGFVALATGTGLVLGRVFPDSSGQLRAFVALVVVSAVAVPVAPLLVPRSDLGLNRPRHWQNSRLLVLPALLAVSPLVFGVVETAPRHLAFLVVAYALTGFTEEVWWRGVVPRVLASLGPRRAVLLSAALFGAAHLGNLVFRDSAGLVLAQAWGAFCFGVGYGALRTRTGTLVPLVVLHGVTDLAAAVGAGPTIPLLVSQDVLLLALGLVLLRSGGRSWTFSDASRVGTLLAPTGNWR